MIIKNENLFRTLVCGPSAIVFSLFAQQAIVSSGPLIFQVFFTLIALYFALSTLSHAATYTNERYEGKAEPLFANKNLSALVLYSPFATISLIIAASTLASSTHIAFKSLFVVLAIVLTLKAIAHAAFYTNDFYEQNASH